jgi:hypothetical protein
MKNREKNFEVDEFFSLDSSAFNLLILVDENEKVFWGQFQKNVCVMEIFPFFFCFSLLRKLMQSTKYIQINLNVKRNLCF